MGEMVQFPCGGGSIEGYEDSRRRAVVRGVVVIQEWWGLVDHIKDVCDRFAARVSSRSLRISITARATKSPDEAGKLMMALRIDEAEKDLSGATRIPAQTRRSDEQEDRRCWFLYGRRVILVHGDEEPPTSAPALSSMAGIQTSNRIYRTCTRRCWVYMPRRTVSSRRSQCESLESKVESTGQTDRRDHLSGERITLSSTIRVRRFTTQKPRPMRGSAQLISFISIW